MLSPYYEESGITIYNADCRDVCASLGAQGAIITDPPYGVGLQYDGDYTDEREGYWEWFLPCMAELIAQFKPVIFTHRQAALKHITGWDWLGVWNKPLSLAARVGNSPVLPHWEPIFMFGIYGLGTTTEYTSDVLTFNPVKSGNSSSSIGRSKNIITAPRKFHPCPKPAGLYAKLIKTFVAQDATAVDPFMGSGTTLHAAKQLGRKAVGIEISEKYCQIAVERLRQSTLNFEVETPKVIEPVGLF